MPIFYIRKKETFDVIRMKVKDCETFNILEARYPVLDQAINHLKQYDGAEFLISDGNKMFYDVRELN